MLSAPLISLRDMSFGYGPGLLFEGFSLEIGQGESLLIQGPSGCGKSTLLRLCVKLESPTGGALAFRGTPYADLHAAELRRHVALLQQLPVMLDDTVRNNLLLGLRFRPHATPPPDDMLLDMLERGRMGEVALDANAVKLSVGQKQRIAFMRLVLLEPAALLLDEPTASLDAVSAGIIDEWIDAAHVRGVTIVLVSHHAEHARGHWRRITLGAAA